MGRPPDLATLGATAAVAAVVVGFLKNSIGGGIGYRLNRPLPRTAVPLALIGIAGAGSLRLLLA